MWQLFKLSLAALPLSGVVGLVSGPALTRAAFGVTAKVTGARSNVEDDPSLPSAVKICCDAQRRCYSTMSAKDPFIDMHGQLTSSFVEQLSPRLKLVVG